MQIFKQCRCSTIHPPTIRPPPAMCVQYYSSTAEQKNIEKRSRDRGCELMILATRIKHSTAVPKHYTCSDHLGGQLPKIFARRVGRRRSYLRRTSRWFLFGRDVARSRGDGAVRVENLLFNHPKGHHYRHFYGAALCEKRFLKKQVLLAAYCVLCAGSYEGRRIFSFSCSTLVE